ncbi:MAG: hypothetical protein JXR48_13595 [Candidatus Delongbacteria bacterium]|nr:hypothetical protein [Candidatus Delongbacteria bacterium]MBN2835990.1 hypothetical protein [Candidatus Delongbacteria bacterium]
MKLFLVLIFVNIILAGNLEFYSKSGFSIDSRSNYYLSPGLGFKSDGFYGENVVYDYDLFFKNKITETYNDNYFQVKKLEMSLIKKHYTMVLGRYFIPLPSISGLYDGAYIFSEPYGTDKLGFYTGVGSSVDYDKFSADVTNFFTGVRISSELIGFNTSLNKDQGKYYFCNFLNYNDSEKSFSGIFNYNFSDSNLKNGSAQISYDFDRFILRTDYSNQLYFTDAINDTIYSKSRFSTYGLSTYIPFEKFNLNVNSKYRDGEYKFVEFGVNSEIYKFIFGYDMYSDIIAGSNNWCDYIDFETGVTEKFSRNFLLRAGLELVTESSNSSDYTDIVLTIMPRISGIWKTENFKLIFGFDTVIDTAKHARQIANITFKYSLDHK